MAKASDTFTESERWEVFLEKLRRVPDRLTALDAAGLSRGALSARLEDDEAFLERYRRAYEDGVDSMEDEAVRRAVVGVLDPVVSQGMIVTHKVRYSDGLMQFFLQAQRSKFRGTDDGEALRPLSDDAKAKMSNIFAAAYVDDPKLGAIAAKVAAGEALAREAKTEATATEKQRQRRAARDLEVSTKPAKAPKQPRLPRASSKRSRGKA